MTDLLAQALHSNALQALERADMAAAHAEQLPISAPHRVTDLDHATLQQLLAVDYPEAHLEGIQHSDAHEGMTSRHTWQLQWNDIGRQADLPSAVFIKATPEQAYLRETLSLLHMAENEVNFYNQLQTELPDLAPHAFHASSHAGGRFLILMESLEERGLRPYWLADQCSLQHALAVVAALAQLHARYWNSPRFSTDLAWIRPRTLRFGFQWHQASFYRARREYLQSELATHLPEAIRQLLQRWNAHDMQVLNYWDSLPYTVLHGDSHLGNTFSYPDGRAGLFDWQVTYRGHGIRDVAYFFLTAAGPSMREQHEKQVVEHYLDTLAEHGVELDRDQAWRHYGLFALDVLDAHIKTVTRGGYGHAASALQRQVITVSDALLAHGTSDSLERIIQQGHL